ncbi:MAG: glycosyl hydrolase [Bacteroidota bacterium]
MHQKRLGLLKNTNKIVPYQHLSLVLIILFGLLTACSTSKEQKIKKEVNVIDEMVELIHTEVDSQYVYDYEKTKYVPSNGKTLLIQGQTYESIHEYKDYFKYQNYPGAWSAYWAVTQSTGITESFKNVTGSTQNHKYLVDEFPNMALHSAMWMVGKWGVDEDTYNGIYDFVIKDFSAWVKTVDRPVYLRIGYEFDGPHNQLEPEGYIRAYRHIVDLMRSEGVNNVAYVWHSYASKTYKGYPVSDWYPGDDYVDWVGISVFFQPYSGIQHKETNDVLEFARIHKKPVMIAEANPVKGIGKKGKKEWDEWFANFFTFTYSKNIKAISFINEDWTRLSIDGIEEWKDARLYNNELISKAWLKETEKKRYLKQSPELYAELGYPDN